MKPVMANTSLRAMPLLIMVSYCVITFSKWCEANFKYHFRFDNKNFSFAVANDQLRGKTDIERAHIIQWMSYADSEILPASSTWVFPLLGIMPFNKHVIIFLIN